MAALKSHDIEERVLGDENAKRRLKMTRKDSTNVCTLAKRAQGISSERNAHPVHATLINIEME